MELVADTLMAQDVVKPTLAWAVFFASVYFTSRLVSPALFAHVKGMNASDRSYWAASVVSTVNGAITAPLAWKAALHGADVGFDVTNSWSVTACNVMLGYTTWDSMLLIWHRNEWKGLGMYFVHHFGALSSWGAGAFSGLGHNLVVPVLYLEATAPFTNLRWVLSAAGLKDTTLYIVNGFMMFLSFFILRICFNWWLFLQRVWVQRDTFGELPLWFRFIVLTLFPVNLMLQMMWFQKICKGIFALLFGSGSKSSKKAK